MSWFARKRSLPRKKGSVPDRKIATGAGDGHQLQSVFAVLREGIVVLDHKERVQSFNPSADLLLGKVLRTGRGLSEQVCQPEILKVLNNARGRERWTLGAIFETEAGRLVQPQAGTTEGGRVVLALRDVTIEQRMESMRREFVANVSHELKTPLTAIRGYAETLVEDLVDPQQSNFAERILVQSSRLEALLRDLMELSEMESEEAITRSDRQSIDLVALLAESLETVAPTLAARAVDVKRQVPDRLIYRGFPGSLEQLVLNLVDNAAKYSNKNGVISVSLRESRTDIEFEVADQGPGIGSEHLPHLFERFYRVDAGRSRASGGTGLGLAIVKHAARVHGGEVSVDSGMGRGTRFRVRLPRPTDKNS